MEKIKKVSYLFIRWFDLNLGWFFINGRKIDSYNKKLKEKYYKGIDIQLYYLYIYNNISSLKIWG